MPNCGSIQVPRIHPAAHKAGSARIWYMRTCLEVGSAAGSLVGLWTSQREEEHRVTARLSVTGCKRSMPNLLLCGATARGAHNKVSLCLMETNRLMRQTGM